MENSNSELGMTFSERVGYILLEETSKQEKINKLKTLFLSSDIPLVSSVVIGDMTFTQAIKPLMREYTKLKLTSFLTDVCINEKFMQEGKILREKASKVFPLSLEMRLVSDESFLRLTDITTPLSRNSLFIKTYNELKDILYAFIFLLFLHSLLVMFVPADAHDLLNEIEKCLNFIFFGYIFTFFLALYKNYYLEYLIRKEIIRSVSLEALLLDEIAYNLFFSSK